MLVEEVDDVGAQAAQRSLRSGAHLLGAAPQAGLVPVGVEGEAELGGDDDLVAHGCQRLADQLLVGVGTVDLGGVEEGDAAVDGPPQQPIMSSRFPGLGP